MSPVFRGRYKARIDGPFVVFIIGMRVNRLRAVHQWLPVARAMGPMVKQFAFAGVHLPAVDAGETAGRRLGRKGEPGVASYKNPHQP